MSKATKHKEYEYPSTPMATSYLTGGSAAQPASSYAALSGARMEPAPPVSSYAPGPQAGVSASGGGASRDPAGTGATSNAPKATPQKPYAEDYGIAKAQSADYPAGLQAGLPSGGNGQSSVSPRAPQRQQPERPYYIEGCGISQPQAPDYAPGIEAGIKSPWDAPRARFSPPTPVQKTSIYPIHEKVYLPAEQIAEQHRELIEKRADALQALTPRTQGAYIENRSVGGASPTYAPGSQAQQPHGIGAMTDQIKQYARLYANTAGRELWDKLWKDPTARQLYTTAKALKSDLNKAQRCLNALNGMGTATASGQLPGIQKELEEKYKLNDMGLLTGYLRRNTADAQKLVEDAGYDYQRLSDFDDMLQAAERYNREVRKWADEAKEHPGWASGLSLLAAPLRGVDFVRTSLEGIGKSDAYDLNSYRNPNVYDMTFTNMVDTIRNTASREIEKNTDWELFGHNVGSLVYDMGMDIADVISVTNTAGSAAPAILGLSSAAQQAKSIIERGGSYDQAIWGGLTVGASELAIGMFGASTMLKITTPSGWKEVLTAVGRKIRASFTDGALAKIATVLCDASVMAGQSDLSQTVRQYQKQDMSEDQAVFRALTDYGLQAVRSGTVNVDADILSTLVKSFWQASH